MTRETAAARRVGLLVIVALGVGIATLLVLGDRQNLFARKNRYSVQFERVNGLTEGSTVQLNGVNVGQVERIVLPGGMDQELLRVEISVLARYEQRIRTDTQARIKTLGLLGDKFLELTSGSPGADVVPNGGVIPAAPSTDVDRLAATGQDVVDDVARIAHQLTTLLGKIERGEGLLGRLLVDEAEGERLAGELDQTLVAIRKTAQGLDDRRGAVGRVLHDRELGDRLAGAVERLESVLAKLDSGGGALGALLSDPATKERVDRILAQLETASTHLAGVAGAIDRPESEALLTKLVSDEEFGREVAAELRGLLANLRSVTEKLDRGEGSAARLLNDPTVAQAVEDILIGVNESKLLRWLIRNRQRKGIETRYEARVEELEAQGTPPAPPE